jgi:hypothetical protein
MVLVQIDLGGRPSINMLPWSNGRIAAFQAAGTGSTPVGSIYPTPLAHTGRCISSFFFPFTSHHVFHSTSIVSSHCLPPSGIASFLENPPIPATILAPSPNTIPSQVALATLIITSHSSGASVYLPRSDSPSGILTPRIGTGCSQTDDWKHK